MPSNEEGSQQGAAARKQPPRSPNPAPKLDCRASRQNCANIDTPDTNWQSNVREENYQDQRSLALVRLLPGEAKRAAPKRQLLQCAPSSRWLLKRWLV